MMWYQQGEPAAAPALVELLSPQLYRFWPAKTGSRADAEGTLQDMWLRIHRVRHTYRPANPCSPGCTPSRTVYEATVIESDIASHRARLELMYCLSSHYRTMGLATCRHSTNLWRLLRPYPKRREVVKMLKAEDLTWKKQPVPRLLPWAP